jgi:hypothetical protein
MVLPNHSNTKPTTTNQNEYCETKGILTNLPMMPSAASTVAIQKTFFVGFDIFIFSPVLK